MTRVSEDVRTEEKVIVFFDICSSTRMLEDLLITENLNAWRNLLIAIKRFLRDAMTNSNGDIYKFIGDGWVLLFPADIPGDKLVSQLTDLCCFFHRQIKKDIVPLLQNTP